MQAGLYSNVFSRSSLERLIDTGTVASGAGRAASATQARESGGAIDRVTGRAALSLKEVVKHI